MIINVIRKIRRMMRLLDWLNTGIHGTMKFYQNYNANNRLHLFKENFMKDFLRCICAEFETPRKQ